MIDKKFNYTTEGIQLRNNTNQLQELSVDSALETAEELLVLFLLHQQQINNKSRQSHDNRIDGVLL